MIVQFQRILGIMAQGEYERGRVCVRACVRTMDSMEKAANPYPEDPNDGMEAWKLTPPL